MRRYFIFVRSPFSQLDKFVASEAERDKVIAEHKAQFPDVPVYWMPVTEA